MTSHSNSVIDARDESFVFITGGAVQADVCYSDSLGKESFLLSLEKLLGIGGVSQFFNWVVYPIVVELGKEKRKEKYIYDLKCVLRGELYT